MGSITVKNEKDIVREVKRALKFMIAQVAKGYTIKEALHQVENAYGKRVHFYVAVSISEKLHTL